MQIIDYLGEVFLCLILACHVCKFNALGGFNVYSCIGLAHVEHHGVSAAHLLHHLARHELADRNKQDYRQNPRKDAHQCRGLLDLLAGGGNICVKQMRNKIVIRQHCGFIDLAVVISLEKNAVVLLLDLNCADLAVIYHIDKSVVVNFLDLMLAYPRHCDKIEHQQKDEHYRIVIHQRLFGGFYFVHVFYSHQNIYCV